MGTKNHPGKFDCYEKALPDEPRFTLLRPVSDYALVGEADALAATGERWRRENFGKWRDNA